MQLLRLNLKNWVHHRAYSCTFTRGLVAILGENGSGKSSLFSAIKWALTGENPNFGVKADNISQYAKDEEPAFVTLEFEHNGHVASVTRYLRPDKEPSVLLVDSEEVARGDRAVTAAIEKFVGVDSKFISRFIIVSQTDIFSFIDDNQRETDKFFQRLFNTAKAEKCAEAIAKQLLEVPVPEILQTPAQLEAEKAGFVEDLRAYDAALAEMPTFEDFLATQESSQKIIQQWERRQAISTETRRAEAALSEAAARHQRTKADLFAREADLAALEQTLAGKSDDHVAAQEALGHWRSYKSVSALRQRLEESAADVAEQRACLAAACPPVVSPTELEKAIGARAEQYARLKSVEEFISTFESAGVTACPTCRTPVADLAAQLEHAKTREVNELRTAIKRLSAQIDEYTEQLEERRLWEAEEKKLEANAKEIAASLTDLVSVAAPEQTEDELVTAVNMYTAYEKAKNDMAPEVAALRERERAEAQAVQKCEELIAELSHEADSIVVTAADAQLAETDLLRQRAEYAKRQDVEADRNQIVFYLQSIDADLAKAKLDTEKAKKLTEWRKLAETARAALKSAPRLVAKRNLKQLEHAINELLQIFNVNFFVRVSTDGTPTFIAEFYDGRRQVAQRLSIGQKTVLALAFRVAVNAMFAEEIGLLALDEPTAALDAIRVRALAPVLEKLRNLSTTKGLQCLLVTHATSLSHLFESTIELEPPELRNVRQSRRSDRQAVH